jgi:hypothetical protein
MATVIFTSSESFMEADTTGRACEHAEVVVVGYLEGTYNMLRHEDQRGSIAFAEYVNDGWGLQDGRRFSDWAVGLDGE